MTTPKMIFLTRSPGEDQKPGRVSVPSNSVITVDAEPSGGSVLALMGGTKVHVTESKTEVDAMLGRNELLG